MIYIAYDIDGNILQKGDYTNRPSSLTYIKHEYDIDLSSYYIENKKLKEKINFPAVLDKTEIIADGIDSANVTEIPNNCQYMISGPLNDYGEILDNTLIITSDIPGEYMIILNSPKYKQGVYKIVAS